MATSSEGGMNIDRASIKLARQKLSDPKLSYLEFCNVRAQSSVLSVMRESERNAGNSRKTVSV